MDNEIEEEYTLNDVLVVEVKQAVKKEQVKKKTNNVSEELAEIQTKMNNNEDLTKEELKFLRELRNPEPPKDKIAIMLDLVESIGVFADDEEAKHLHIINKKISKNETLAKEDMVLLKKLKDENKEALNQAKEPLEHDEIVEILNELKIIEAEQGDLKELFTEYGQKRVKSVMKLKNTIMENKKIQKKQDEKKDKNNYRSIKAVQ